MKRAAGTTGGKPSLSFAVQAQIVTEEGDVREGVVTVRADGIIDSVAWGSRIPSDSPECERIEANDHYLLPGFIDLHVHGGNGHDFMDAEDHAFHEITRFHALHGTTAMLATTVTAPREHIEAVLMAAERFRSRPMPYAQLLGVHLEGPFISPKWPGAQNPEHIVRPQPDWVRQWLGRHPSLIRIVTLAPETDGAAELIRYLAANGVIVSCGHTDATHAETVQAIKDGLSHAAHLFNAMRGFHHREPGAIGAILTDEAVTAEVIADGHHVHPAALQMLFTCKTDRNLMLITDAISAAGMGDGDFQLGGLEVTVQGGVARLKQGGQLAGSTLTMLRAFRYVVETIGLSLPQASRLASLHPAIRLGIDSQTGSIAPGKRADLLLLSPDLHIKRVWIGGRQVNP